MNEFVRHLSFDIPFPANKHSLAHVIMSGQPSLMAQHVQYCNMIRSVFIHQLPLRYNIMDFGFPSQPTLRARCQGCVGSGRILDQQANRKGDEKFRIRSDAQKSLEERDS